MCVPFSFCYMWKLQPSGYQHRLDAASGSGSNPWDYSPLKQHPNPVDELFFTGVGGTSLK